MAWQDMALMQRIEAAHIDIMRHKEFSAIGGVLMVGTVKIKESMPTAGTDGRDVEYGAEFIRPFNRKQLRYLVLHENFHKMLHHCYNYKEVCKKYPRLSNMAMDYVVNGLIEDMDAGRGFVERPVPDTLVDAKYSNQSFLEVLKQLIRDAEEQGQDPRAGGQGSLDEHMEGELEGVERRDLEDTINEAVRQSEITRSNLAGKGSRNGALDAMAKESVTDWREALREFVSSVCVGDDLSRLCPPNRRFLALDIILWSHFSESSGEMLIACDTSGSMSGVYPVVFGEIARIAQVARPEAVRIVWWDSDVCGEQLFTPENYDGIGAVLKPKGGGGTEPQAVVQYIAEKKYTPKALIWLTDGYLDAGGTHTDMPQLWGVVDNTRFVPPQGKVMHINSMMG